MNELPEGDPAEEIQPAPVESVPSGSGSEARGELPGAGGDVAPEPAGHELHLPQFEGPLHLLLQLIERRELDITELSLLEVTAQYHALLRADCHLNLDELADFVAIGARLLLLKSRRLLPGPEAEPEPEEETGESLVEMLREYRRYRQAADYLGERQGQSSYRREAPPPDVPLPSGLEQVTLGSLVEVLQEVMSRIPETSGPETVPLEQVRLRDRLTHVVELLERQGRVSFRLLIEAAGSRMVVIVDFLAILELIKAGYLLATQSERFGDIDLVRIEGAVLPDLADVREFGDDFIGG